MLASNWASNHGPDFADQVFAIGDVHGQADALESLLDHIDSIPRDGRRRELIFLGDLCDRGPDSLRAFELAWNASSLADARHILPGNHELMMLIAFEGRRRALADWHRDGGCQTLRCVDPDEDLPLELAVSALRKALPKGLEDLLRGGPTHLVREGILFVHAGLHPLVEADEFLGQHGTIWRGRFPGAHWAHVRRPFLAWEDGWEVQGFKWVVHGHTPATMKPLAAASDVTELMCATASKRRICVDVGATVCPQVAAVEFLGAQHRLHVAPAPQEAPC
ncbi:serine/threonine protein phosphatase 1 [Limimaricola soesokkakensis]|uniref:Bis(5'-nucleosyl)-tetraphosphatase PrpE [asymmetrical] n=2 Tax=Limimaricola soesokkakensis TaxID=1343159 RepID=A0A1X6ZRZ8_9RHOB|nr:serine/threonine protein phosphatase 1 [Limimaricola soesokkakensis]SLN59815.1 Bis(5'-nucleosyl)-tetraphosphatase PrpE [asymmetrical] [Limimaricola soesokkakensis]